MISTRLRREEMQLQNKLKPLSIRKWKAAFSLEIVIEVSMLECYIHMVVGILYFMTIHFFTFSDAQGGSSRQRAFKVAHKLQERGFNIAIHKPPVLFISRTPWPRKGTLIYQVIRSLFSIQKGDVIFLQRTISNKYFFVIMVTYLFIFRRKMIFDFDDPVYLHSFFKTKVFTRMADVVITCSHAQAEWAKQYNNNVHIIHISLDFPKYKKFTKNYSIGSTPQIIGWVGNAPEHVNNLEILASVFRKLLKKTTLPFKFVLIGALKDKKIYDLFQQIPNLNVEFIDELEWNDPESVPREIQKFDIGVVTHQSEGEWNKAKTSFKVLEYMSCGVATVVSKFGEMPYVIQDGVNGCIADTEEEWVEKLEILLANKELRTKLGSGGQKRVQEEYCYDTIVPRLIDILTCNYNPV